MFYDYCSESFEVFINSKKEIVGMVDMYARHFFKYLFMCLFYEKTDEVEPTKEDYKRLYPKQYDKIQFSN